MASTGQIVICDDQFGRAAELAAALEGFGYEVTIVADGYEAIDLLQSHPPAVFLLEVMLHHGLNGFGVLSHIEQELPELVPRTFIVTNMAEQSVLRFAPRFGSRTFRKPVEPADLAIAISEATSHETPVPAAPTVEKDLVLVVDDDAETRRFLAMYLESQSFRTLEAADGRAAIAALEEASPALILLDLVMPGIDGASVLEHLNEADPSLLDRTVILTGVPRHYIDMLPPRPVRGVLTKPIDLEQLRSLLDSSSV